MTRRVFLIAAFLLAASFDSAAQETACRRHAEAAGGYSFCVPEGWSVGGLAGQKYQLALGPPSRKLRPNIFFIDEENAQPLPDYVTANVSYTVANPEKSGASSMKLAERSDFTTDAQLAGVRVAYSAKSDGLKVRTLQYFFAVGPGRKMIVTCTVPEAERKKLGAICDRALKTFRID